MYYREIDDLSDEQIEKVFSNVDVVNIPEKFIELIKLKTTSGESYVFTGPEFKEFVNNSFMVIGSVEVALNLDIFSDDVNYYTQQILESVSLQG